MKSNKKLDFLESFHYENVSVGNILGRLYLDLLLQLPNIQLEFWLRNTGSKIRCSMSFSIEMNGKTVEPLNFPVFGIHTQKRSYQLPLMEKNYPMKHWWKPEVFRYWVEKFKSWDESIVTAYVGNFGQLSTTNESWFSTGSLQQWHFDLLN